VKPQPDRKNILNFENFCGLWTKDDLDEFEKKTSALKKIDDLKAVEPTSAHERLILGDFLLLFLCKGI